VVNPSTFKVYNASAGSGKTFTLVKEYLKIILQNTDVFYFQKILAITFTNKAATEMKERILYNLQCFAKKQKTPMWQSIQEETGLKTALIQERALKITGAILQNYTAFNITTIDSFTHRIIRSFAYDFGLSLDFDVELDTQKLLQEAVDAVLDQIGVNPELTEVLIHFSLQKSNEDKTWDIAHTLSDFAKILLNETDKIDFQTIEHQSFTSYKRLQKDISNRQTAIYNTLQELGDKGKELLKENLLESRYFNYQMLPKFFDSLSEKKDVSELFIKGRLSKRFEENTLLKKSAGATAQQAFDRIYQACYQIFLDAERHFHQWILLKLFKESIIPLAVLSFINKALKNIQEENNIRMISEFNELIFKKIQNEPTPFIYERLGEKFQHYFIDEMQDTSVLQWKNLAKLIDNALTQEGGSLLLVGDAKQAIYRWRGGASEQFIELAEPENSRPFLIPKTVVNLDTNYRSFSEIIQFNNDFFQHLSGLLQNKAYQELYQAGNRQKFNSKQGGYVQLELVDFNENVLEKEWVIPDTVLQTIHSLQGDFQWKDITVLVRKRKDAIKIANYLTENDIPIISSETLLLARHTKVVFLIDLLRFIHQPNDKESSIALLDYLYNSNEINTTKHLFFNQLIHLKQQDFFTGLKHFGFDFNLQKFHTKSLYEAVEYSIKAFDLEDQPNAYIHYFLDTLIDFQSKNGSDLSGFLEYWDLEKDKLSIAIPEGRNAIRIMTIHKAKGLQFPVVIFPYDLDIYKQINPKIWYPIATPEKFQNFKTLLIPYNSSLQYTDETGLHLYQERQAQLELDNFNLLYVALTRAVEQLYIITDYKKQENIRYFSGLYIDYLQSKNLWNPEKKLYAFGDKTRVITKENTSNTCTHTNIQNIEATRFINTDRDSHSIRIYTQAALLWDTKQGKAIEYGNLLHELLAQIKTLEDIHSTLEIYKTQGIIADSQIHNIRDRLIAVVSHPELHLYYEQGLTVLNEREIMTDELKIIIPDRLVFFPDNRVVILDYKTGKTEKKHQKQINSYGVALKKMGYQIMDKLLVYIGKQEVRVEKVI